MKTAPMLLMLVALIALAACQPASTSTLEVGTPIATAKIASDQWQTFSSKEGGFTLLLPGQPKEQRQPVRTTAGPIDTISYMIEMGNKALGVGYSDYPKGALSTNPQTVLAGARDGAVKNINGTIVNEKSIELAGHPGLEIVAEIPDSSTVPGGGIYRARFYLVGNRLYQVIYVGSKSEGSSADYQKLFDSFQLDNPTVSGTPSAVMSSSLKDWIEYRSDEGRFTVLLPTQPKVDTQLAETAAGQVEVTMTIAEMQNHAAGVLFNDFPDVALANPQAVLNAGREGAAKSVNGKVVSYKPIKLGNYPGTEFVVETSNGLIYTARAYLVKNRMYQLIFIVPKDQIDQFDVQGFFDSFKLLGN